MIYLNVIKMTVEINSRAHSYLAKVKANLTLKKRKRKK